MKKTYLTVLFLFACSYVFSQGVIREITGTVEIKNSGSASFTAANVGDQLRQDTVISTSFRSFAIIEIGHSTLTVRPLTRLSLTEIQTSADEEKLNVNLQSGRVRVDVKPPAGTRATMSVQSPSAVASVRGTSFEFDTRNLFVTDGSVSLSGTRGKEIIVKAGNEGRISTNSKAVTVKEARPSKVTTIPLTAGMTSRIFRAPTQLNVPFIIGLKYQ